MNADIKVSIPEGEDSERAEIKIRSWGAISELRFDRSFLRGVAEFTSVDVGRLIETIKAAEKQRVDPDPKMIAALDYVVDRVHIVDEDQSRLYLNIEAEMPIAASGSVLLTVNPCKEMPNGDDE